jgi:multiple sugar transport system permease protein
VRRRLGPWLRFALVLALTALLLVPVALPIARLFAPTGGQGGRGGQGDPLLGLIAAATNPPVTTWLVNSVLVSGATVLVTLSIAAPAGYVLSRGRARLVHGFALLIFALQAAPIIVFLIPLFVLFAGLGLVDSLVGVTLVYIGIATAVGIWTMSSYFDTIPVQLEEAAWLDGCTVFRGFTRVVLRNSLPGVLATAVFTLLLAWNDYWIAVVFLRSDTNYTIGLALASAGGFPGLSVIALIPPLVVFAVLNRYFSFGGINGSLSGR